MEFVIVILLFAICFGVYGVTSVLEKILAELRKPEQRDKSEVGQA